MKVHYLGSTINGQHSKHSQPEHLAKRSAEKAKVELKMRTTTRDQKKCLISDYFGPPGLIPVSQLDQTIDLTLDDPSMDLGCLLTCDEEPVKLNPESVFDIPIDKITHD